MRASCFGLLAILLIGCDPLSVYRAPDELDTATGCEMQTWFLDLDGDGFGDVNSFFQSCTAPARYVSDATDCDDTSAAVNTAASEVCDGTDNDCDSEIDVDAIDASTWYADADSDGFGDSSASSVSCEAPEGHVADNSDCVDTDSSVSPGETETCNEIDDNCDGTVDEDATTTFYADSDGDSYGDLEISDSACEAPEGYVSDATDCDDASSAISPAAIEVCDLVDNDCDGTSDEDDADDASTWYTDADSDGYGDAASSTASCSAPSGTVADATDCDDTDASVNTAASEVCDLVDNDCDGFTDPSTSEGAGTWYADVDVDGYGDASNSIVYCSSPVGYIADATDCDDGDASSFPGGTEVCDGADNDCDGETDPDSSSDASTWYADADSDTFGDASASSVSCEADDGYVSDATDCDDTDASVNTAASEVCDGTDNDCDSEIDEEVKVTFYGDRDNDGYGNASISESACEASEGYVSDGSDCDDLESSVNPGASEVCDEIDNDCDEMIDDEDSSTDTSTMSEFYVDADADTFGDASVTVTACDVPSGYVADATDCDDTDVGSYPDAPESCDGADNDCDETIDENLSDEWYVDADGDLYGEGSAIDVICGGDSADLVDNADDCDDADAGANPDATETCNGVDDNCDGQIDEDVMTTFYADADADGYGNALDSESACSAPDGYVENSSDCDDTDATVSPTATEIDADLVDNDCDGGTDDLGVYCCLDGDDDGFGDGETCSYAGTGVCDDGYAASATDCDDDNPTVYPGAYDSAYDGEDSDCDTRED